MGSAPQAQVVHRGLASLRGRFDVVELQKFGFSAPVAFDPYERALPLIAVPDFALHPRGDVTSKVSPPSSGEERLFRRALPAFQLLEQRIEGPLEHFLNLGPRNGVPEKPLNLA